MTAITAQQTEITLMSFKPISVKKAPLEARFRIRRSMKSAIPTKGAQGYQVTITVAGRDCERCMVSTYHEIPYGRNTVMIMRRPMNISVSIRHSLSALRELGIDYSSLSSSLFSKSSVSIVKPPLNPTSACGISISSIPSSSSMLGFISSGKVEASIFSASSLS